MRLTCSIWTAFLPAACIVGWHLNEARRLLADLDAPPSLAAAIRLDAWLRNEAQANGTDRVPTKRIYWERRNARSELRPGQP